MIKVEPPDGEHSRHVGLQAALGVSASPAAEVAALRARKVV